MKMKRNKVKEMLVMKSFIIFLLMSLSISCGSGISDSGNTGSGVVVSVLSKIYWTAPTYRTDNSILQTSEIAFFRIYYGTESGVYLSAVEIYYPDTSVNLSILGSYQDTYFVVVTTIDTGGRESSYSEEIEIMVGL
jgi:hypothetical protein